MFLSVNSNGEGECSTGIPWLGCSDFQTVKIFFNIDAGRMFTYSGPVLEHPSPSSRMS